MTQWHFTLAAYALTIVVTSVLLLASLVAMRRAEAAAEAVRRR